MKESHHGEIRELTRDEIERFLKEHMLGRLSLCLGNVPYIVPISYVYHDNKIYFHMATKGKKVEFIQGNSQACFEVDEWGETGWLSVICYGTVSLHNDFETKKMWFEALNEIYHGGQEIPDERIKNMNAYIGVMEIEKVTGRSGQMEKPMIMV